MIDASDGSQLGESAAHPRLPFIKLLYASNVAQFHCDCLLENFLKERKKHLQYCLNKELKDVYPFILAIF